MNCVPQRPMASCVSRTTSREDRGGYDCQLVDPPPTHIQTECSVCLQLLRDPCIVSCCGHKFCRECIEQVRDAGKDCPLCNGRDFSFMVEHSLDRTLLELDVFCSARSQAQGCSWRGKLRDLERHLNRSYSEEDQLNGCGFVEVTCIHKDCGAVLERGLAAEHQTSACGKRPHSCEYCGDYRSTYEDVVQNHILVCGRYPVCCPRGCPSSPFERRFADQHLKDECPLVVVQCPFHYAGCQVSLPTNEMGEHARDVFSHFAMLAGVTQKLVLENSHLRSKLERVEAEMEEKERFVLNRLSHLSTTCCACQHFVRHKELGYTTSPGQSDTVVNCSLVSSTMEIEMRSMYFAVLPYEFKIEHFLSYSKGEPVECSPIFYTHSCGYRFCVKVVRTEYSKLLSLDAFTSVYVEILPGPFDDCLDWPFVGSITVAIVNQLGDFNHCEKGVEFGRKVCEEKQRVRPERGGGVSACVRPFIYHKQLRSRHSRSGQLTHYLEDGALHFRITKIELST